MYTGKMLPFHLKKIGAILAGSVLLFCMGACGMFFGGNDGFGDAEIYDLDGTVDFVIETYPNERFVLDMRKPDGYSFKGAAFDPALLRLDGFYDQTGEDGSRRIQYMFTALQTGQSPVTVKIYRPEDEDYPVENYKQVEVDIKSD